MLSSFKSISVVQPLAKLQHGHDSVIVSAPPRLASVEWIADLATPSVTCSPPSRPLKTSDIWPSRR